MTLHACPECGCLLTKTRSLPDHRRFFAIIHAAFHQWPERRQFRDADQFRAYLLIKCGHVDVTSIEAPEGYAENPAIRDLFRLAVESTAKAFADDDGWHDIRVSAGGIEIVRNRSINWQTVSQREFGPIRDAVESLIETSLGVSVQQLLTEKAA